MQSRPNLLQLCLSLAEEAIRLTLSTPMHLAKCGIINRIRTKIRKRPFSDKVPKGGMRKPYIQNAALRTDK